jgi:enoyl-CoA hydratase
MDRDETVDSLATVLRQDRQHFSVLTLNRPKRRNALSGELITALQTHLNSLENNKEIRAIVITGSGSGFCSGGDLAGGMMNSDGVVAAHEGRAAFGELLLAMRKHRAIIIAAVHGDALGGGLGLATGCDLVVADAKARFGTPEIRLGLFPWVILAVLNRHVGQKRLMEMVMTGEKMSAAAALQIGLINRVVEEGTCMEEAERLASDIAGRAPIPLSLGKAAFYHVADQTFEDSIQYLNTQLSLNLMTEDAMEGVGAFLQRRAPVWKGR